MFWCNKKKKTLDGLRKKRTTLMVEYEELMSQTRCSLCECYNPNEYKTYSGKFVNCQNGPLCLKMKALAQNLDELNDKIASLDKD